VPGPPISSGAASDRRWNFEQLRPEARQDFGDQVRTQRIEAGAREGLLHERRNYEVRRDSDWVGMCQEIIWGPTVKRAS
jgi:hypothetical protein